MEVDEEVDSKKLLDQKKRRSCKNSCGIWRSSRMCHRTFQAGSKKSCSSSFKILSKSGRISSLRAKECRRYLRMCRVCWTKRNNAKRMLANAMETWSGLKTRLQKGRFSSKNWNKGPRQLARQSRSWMKKSETLKQARKDETAERRSPTVAALIRRGGSSTSVAADPSSSRGVFFKDLRCCINPQPHQCIHREEEEEETKMRRSSGKEQLAARWVNMRHGRNSVFQLVLFLILLGFQRLGRQ